MQSTIFEIYLHFHIHNLSDAYNWLVLLSLSKERLMPPFPPREYGYFSAPSAVITQRSGYIYPKLPVPFNHPSHTALQLPSMNQ